MLYNLIRFDGQEWHVEILSESEGRIDTFGLSAQGTPWMSAFDNYTRSSKFMAFDGENWINMMSGMYPKGILNTIFLDFAAAPDNSVWFLGEDMMVHKQLYDEDLFMDAHAYGSHTTNQGYTFLPDSSMYFAAENGLILNDPETRTTEIINSAGELISNQIKQMQVDKNGLVWIMVGQIGQNTSVQGFNGESWKTFFENQDFLSFIYDKYQTYWIYTNGGFLYKSSIVDGKTVFNMVKQEDGLLYHSLTQPFEDAEGNIWVGHNANVAAGASMWNGEEWQTFDCTDSNAPDCYGPEKFFNAPDGTLWAKIYSGGDPSPLNYFQNGEWYTLEGSEILQDGYSDLVFNKEGNPVVVYANDETNVLKEYNGPEDTTFWSTIDIPGEIASVAYQNNTLWVATKNDGLFYRIDSENEIGELLPVDNVPWESEKLNVLIPDNHGNLWLGTNGGVYLYTSLADPSNPNQFQGIWQSFDEIEESGFGYVHTIEIDPSGDVWFASTSQGVAKFDYP